MYLRVVHHFELFCHGFTDFKVFLEFFRVSVASFSSLIAATFKLSDFPFKPVCTMIKILPI